MGCGSLAGEAVGGLGNGECTKRPQCAYEQTVVEIDVSLNASSREPEAKVEVEQVEEL